MWRAYSEGAGVALVLNNTAFLTPSGGLKAYASPVAYLNDQGFEDEFDAIAKNITNEADFLRAQGREAVTGRIFNILRFAGRCTKHPGFAEGKEWRVIYCPTLGQLPY